MPTAMPMAMVKKIKPTSRVSLTALRKRMIDSAPTNEKARAMSEPMTSITSATIMPFSTRVKTKLWVYDVPRCVIL